MYRTMPIRPTNPNYATQSYIGRPIDEVCQECLANNIPHYIYKRDGKLTGVIITAVVKPSRIGFSVSNGLVDAIKRG